MKNEKDYTIVSINLGIKQKATTDDWERYEALLVTFSNYLFQNEIGDWGGRETSLLKGGGLDISRVNYWYVLFEEKNVAVNELMRMCINFSLLEVTKIEIGEPIKSKKNEKKRFKDRKTLCWEYHRDK
jgi:hypothetical protein